MNKSMNKSKALALAVVLTALGGTAAYAQGNINPDTATGTDNWHARFQDACGTDMQQFCANMQPGDGKLRDCMNQHQNELTAKCRDFREEARARWTAMHEKFEKACKDDVSKFCSDIKPGMGRMTDCLQSHATELSSGCRDETQAMQRKIHERTPASKK